MPETNAAFDPVSMLRVLIDHGVEFVLIGGLAAAVRGSPYATVDADIVPRLDDANLERLSAALTTLGARVYVSPDQALAFEHDGRSLRDATIWNLSTDFGGLDISFRPAGTSGYVDLAERAGAVDIGGIVVSVAALEDIVRSKEAAGRDKDNVVLPALRRLLEMGDERAPR